MKKNEIYLIIANVLEVNIENINDELSVGDIPQWDSLAHMLILEAVEKASGISLDIEEIIEIEDVQDIVDAFQN
tara:strand:+ start:1941 stop:2162 length:222 start_codon:yes stop_codon:yes gene_type:complete